MPELLALQDARFSARGKIRDELGRDLPGGVALISEINVVLSILSKNDDRKLHLTHI